MLIGVRIMLIYVALTFRVTASLLRAQTALEIILLWRITVRNSFWSSIISSKQYYILKRKRISAPTSRFQVQETHNTQSCKLTSCYSEIIKYNMYYYNYTYELQNKKKDKIINENDLFSR